MGGMFQMNKRKRGFFIRLNIIDTEKDNFINTPDYSCQLPDSHYTSLALKLSL